VWSIADDRSISFGVWLLHACAKRARRSRMGGIVDGPLLGKAPEVDEVLVEDLDSRLGRNSYLLPGQRTPGRRSREPLPGGAGSSATGLARTTYDVNGSRASRGNGAPQAEAAAAWAGGRCAGAAAACPPLAVVLVVGTVVRAVWRRFR
jgi:hypothetical protein